MVIIEKSPKIEHRVGGPFSIITFVDEKTLNSMDGNDYLYLAHLLVETDKNPDVSFTVLQSRGRFFSSGANFSSIATQQKVKSENGELPKWASMFMSRNAYVTNAFVTHSKPLICCLNGPAIGLSAALVMLCDIVYSMNDKVYLQLPFAKIGLVTEGCISITLPLKLGYSRAQQILFFNKPVTYDLLEGTVSLKNYDMSDWKEFNEATLQDLKQDLKGLNLASIIGMKSLIKDCLLYTSRCV